MKSKNAMFLVKKVTESISREQTKRLRHISKHNNTEQCSEEYDLQDIFSTSNKKLAKTVSRRRVRWY